MNEHPTTAIRGIPQEGQPITHGGDGLPLPADTFRPDPYPTLPGAPSPRTPAIAAPMMERVAAVRTADGQLFMDVEAARTRAFTIALGELLGYSMQEGADRDVPPNLAKLHDVVLFLGTRHRELRSILHKLDIGA